MNVLIPFTAIAGILTYAWPFAQSKSSLIAVTVVYGQATFHLFRGCGIYYSCNATMFNRFCSGVYISLLANPIMEIGEPWDVGRRTGMFISISAVGSLTGPPISGAIRSATGDFKAVGYYAGRFGSFFVAHPSRSTLFFFRNGYPCRGWYVVINTVSYSTKDVRKDMTGMTFYIKLLFQQKKSIQCHISRAFGSKSLRFVTQGFPFPFQDSRNLKLSTHQTALLVFE